jgi:hypothetical protein
MSVTSLLQQCITSTALCRDNINASDVDTALDLLSYLQQEADRGVHGFLRGDDMSKPMFEASRKSRTARNRVQQNSEEEDMWLCKMALGIGVYTDPCHLNGKLSRGCAIRISQQAVCE